MVENPWKYYLRWRHSHGFGVHSPYAYRFVTEVLRPGCYGYYAYDTIDENLSPASRSAYRTERFVRFLIRLAYFLKTERLVSLGKPNPGIKAAALCLNIPCVQVDSHKSFRFLPGDLVLTDQKASQAGDMVKEETEMLEDAIANGVAIMSLGATAGLRRLLRKPMDNGVLFDGGKRLLLIPRETMAYIDYSINLKF